MERIQLEILLFDSNELDRVNLLELIADDGKYHIYENYGDREAVELVNSLVASFDNLILAAARFDTLALYLQLLGFRSAKDGEVLDIPGFYSTFSEKNKFSHTVITDTAIGTHRLLDI
jgi:hypothetical protein